MRVIAAKTLRSYWAKEPRAEQALKSWYSEAEQASWDSPHALKQQYRNASILGGKRVVFNIHGNEFRLIVDVEYRRKLVFIVWVGTHAEYDKFDARTVAYAKAD